MKTSEKGDVGLAMVMADLTKKGYALFLPLGDHQAFDQISLLL